MKKTLLIAALLTITSTANAAALCQSTRDPGYRAWFEGWSCPSGFYMIKTR